MRLLVLAVLPGVGGEDKRHREPPGRTAERLLMVGEDDLLPYGSVHLRPEGFVGDDDVEPALVGERRRGHRLFVERRDDRTADRLGDAALGRGHPELERVERLLHPVAAHLVGVAHARSEVRVRPHCREEAGVDRCHRRGRHPVRSLGPSLSRLTQDRIRRGLESHVARRERVVALARAAGARVVLEPRGRRAELVGSDPELPRGLVEASGGSGIGVRVGAEREVVGEVRARAVESGALGRHGDPVR